MFAFLAPQRLAIEVTKGVDVGKTAELKGDGISIGRSPGSTLRLTDPQVQYRHCLIQRRVGEWMLTTDRADLTTVDNVSRHKFALRRGMRIVLAARVELTVVAAGGPGRSGQLPKARSGRPRSWAGSGIVVRRVVMLAVLVAAVALLVLRPQLPGSRQAGPGGPADGGDRLVVAARGEIEACLRGARHLGEGGRQGRLAGVAEADLSSWYYTMADLNARQQPPGGKSAAIIEEVRAMTERRLVQAVLFERRELWDEALVKYQEVLSSLPDMRCTLVRDLIRHIEQVRSRAGSS